MWLVRTGSVVDPGGATPFEVVGPNLVVKSGVVLDFDAQPNSWDVVLSVKASNNLSHLTESQHSLTATHPIYWVVLHWRSASALRLGFKIEPLLM